MAQEMQSRTEVSNTFISPNFLPAPESTLGSISIPAVSSSSQLFVTPHLALNLANAQVTAKETHDGAGHGAEREQNSSLG